MSVDIRHLPGTDTSQQYNRIGDEFELDDWDENEVELLKSGDDTTSKWEARKKRMMAELGKMRKASYTELHGVGEYATATSTTPDNSPRLPATPA